MASISMSISEKDFVTLPDDKTFIWEIIKINKQDIKVKLIARRWLNKDLTIVSGVITKVGNGFFEIFVPIDEETRNKLLKLMVFE